MDVGDENNEAENSGPKTVSTASKDEKVATTEPNDSEDDFSEVDEEQSSSNIEYLLSKMKDPVDARPVDDTTDHGKNIIAKRLQNRQTRDARSIVFENFSSPSEQLEQWPRCPAMSSRDLERQKYVAKLQVIMADAKKLNGVMADARIRQIGKK